MTTLSDSTVLDPLRKATDGYISYLNNDQDKVKLHVSVTSPLLKTLM